METVFERITRWKQMNEWQQIQEVFTAATTMERYYNICSFARQVKAVNPYHYREKTVADEEFIRQFGFLDVEYLKKAQKSMNRKCTK